VSAPAADYRYVGSELEIFALAENWKRYLRAQMAPYFGAEVLEVGAGMGATTRALCGDGVRRWVCLEPDAELAGRIDLASLPAACQVRRGTVADLDAGERFDAILYVDVLEHVDDDRAELAAAARHLRDGGRLIVLAPAHAWLFTPFDERIGHRRRYTRRALTAAAPPELRLERCRYLDSVGLLASLGNRLLLRRAMPSREQILFWDRFMTTLSRRLDPLTGWRVGKSVLGIWTR
jgi:SAM-dependent methyltransferase